MSLSLVGLAQCVELSVLIVSDWKWSKCEQFFFSIIVVIKKFAMSLKILFGRNYQTADHLLCLIKSPNWRLKVILQKTNKYKEVQNHSRKILLCFCFIQQFLNYIIYWKYRLNLPGSFVFFTDSHPRWLYILYNEFKDLLRLTKELPNGEMNC